MLNIDISYNREKLILSFAFVRIKPKNIPKEGEICTYKLLFLNKKGKSKETDIKIDFPYGDALKLANKGCEILSKLNTEVLNKYNFGKEEFRKTSKDTLMIEISINREETTHLFILKETRKKDSFNIKYKKPYSHTLIDLKEKVVFSEIQTNNEILFFIKVLENIANNIKIKNYDFTSLNENDKFLTIYSPLFN